jgi:hypothetical protein
MLAKVFLVSLVGCWISFSSTDEFPYHVLTLLFDTLQYISQIGSGSLLSPRFPIGDNPIEISPYARFLFLLNTEHQPLPPQFNSFVLSISFPIPSYQNITRYLFKSHSFVQFAQIQKPLKTIAKFLDGPILRHIIRIIELAITFPDFHSNEINSICSSIILIFSPRYTFDYITKLISRISSSELTFSSPKDIFLSISDLNQIEFIKEQISDDHPLAPSEYLAHQSVKALSLLRHTNCLFFQALLVLASQLY